MTRQTTIKANINRDFKTKRDRLKYINILRNTVEEVLKEGYSPYASNVIENEYSVKSALEYALELKKSTVKESTYSGYKKSVGVFIKFLTKRGLDSGNIKNIDKKIVNEFLNEILKTSSASNRNNYRQELSAIFSLLAENDYIDYNFFDQIKKLSTTPVRNKTYSTQEVDKIYSHLEKEDKLLLLFIKFVSYNFLRPIEVARLKVEDIDLINKTLTVKAKNKVLKTKIIPDILIEDIKKMRLTKKHYFLFTPHGVGEWQVTETFRRRWFGNRFNKAKETLNIGDNYTLYSFRHTFITKLYRELRKTYSKRDTEDNLMLITGHSTLSALQKYLRDIDAELPMDYSKMLK
jgi:integrase